MAALLPREPSGLLGGGGVYQFLEFANPPIGSDEAVLQTLEESHWNNLPLGTPFGQQTLSSFSPTRRAVNPTGSIFARILFSLFFF